jgi:hypothetical protein
VLLREPFELGQGEVTHCPRQHKRTNQFLDCIHDKVEGRAERIAQVAPLAESVSLPPQLKRE